MNVLFIILAEPEVSMKRFLMVLTAAVVAMTCGQPAGAQGICSDCFTASGVVGGYSFDGVQHLETRPVVGVRGGYNFTRYFGFEALFDYVRTESTRGEGDANAYRYGGDLLLHLLPDQRLVPFLAAGYSGISIDRENARTFSDGVFDYGAGVKYFLNDSMALRADFRHLVLRDVQTIYNYEYTVGLAWQFGERTAAAKVSTPEQAQPAAPAAPKPPEEAKPQVEPPPEPVPSTEPAPKRYKYCITLHIEDDIDRAAIRPEYQAEMAKVGDFMEKYPDTTAVIEGHADNVGTAQHNRELSKRRAETVVDYLVGKYGIDRPRLTAEGFGSSRPIADNATDEGRQKNRRVEAIIDCAFDVKEAKPPERLCTRLEIEFASGSAKIRPEYRDEIAWVAEYMNKYPTTTALIEGHTDNVGGYAFNMRLSQERAQSVVDYLAEHFGIDRSRLSAKGYGYTRRIAYNATPEGRQKNRRINAVIDCVVKR